MRQISVATRPDCLCEWQTKWADSPLFLCHSLIPDRNHCVDLRFVDQYSQFHIDSLRFIVFGSVRTNICCFQFPLNVNLIPATNARLLRTLRCLMRKLPVKKNEWCSDPNLMPNDWLVNPNSLRSWYRIADRSSHWVNLLQVFRKKKKHFYSGHGGRFANCSSTVSALEIACLAACASRCLNLWTWSQSKPTTAVPMRHRQKNHM